MLLMCSPVAVVSTDQSSYTVSEDVGQLEVWINITDAEVAPGQQFPIVVETTDETTLSEFHEHRGGTKV